MDGSPRNCVYWTETPCTDPAGNCALLQLEDERLDHSHGRLLSAAHRRSESAGQEPLPRCFEQQARRTLVAECDVTDAAVGMDDVLDQNGPGDAHRAGVLGHLRPRPRPARRALAP